MTSEIVHLCSRRQWEDAQRAGEYRADSLELEGFIHCSRPTQMLDVANAFYRGTRDMVLLWISPELVQAKILWEPPVHPQNDSATTPKGNTVPLFPHIYGPLNIDAVTGITPLEPGPDGRFTTLGK